MIANKIQAPSHGESKKPFVVDEATNPSGGTELPSSVACPRSAFIPANDPIPLKEDGGLDWEKVDEVEIIEIVDPH